MIGRNNVMCDCNIIDNGGICNYCDECQDDDIVHCKFCRSYHRHDKYFGFCRLHNRQCKFDETCNQGVNKYGE